MGSPETTAVVSVQDLSCPNQGNMTEMDGEMIPAHYDSKSPFHKELAHFICFEYE